MLEHLLINTVALYELVPVRDASGGNVPTPTLLRTPIICNVQLGSFSNTLYWQAQGRMSGMASVYFEGDIGIEVSLGTPIKDYLLKWLDAPQGTLNLRVLGYSESTLGRFLVWTANCQQVK